MNSTHFKRANKLRFCQRYNVDPKGTKSSNGYEKVMFFLCTVGSRFILDSISPREISSQSLTGALFSFYLFCTVEPFINNCIWYVHTTFIKEGCVLGNCSCNASNAVIYGLFKNTVPVLISHKFEPIHPTFTDICLGCL